jgi:hypothetical protein
MNVYHLFVVLAVVALATIAGCTGSGVPRDISPAGTAGTVPSPAATIPSPAVSPVVVQTTAADPFPAALALGEMMSFGMGNVASMGTVYRYWINDTYQWHNDLDNNYYTEVPPAGSKYLVIFVYITNNGNTAVWYPQSKNIVVHYDGTTYTRDPAHYLPDITEDREATPIEIQEIQYYRKQNEDEYVEDFGYSHGTNPDRLYPGASNSIDGYIIYVVPASLAPEKTYVEIPFNGQDTGIWKLA